MTEADLAGGLRLSRASGWNQTLEDWRLLARSGPGLFRVGVADGRVVASGGAVRYGDRLAWICMILVEPDERGHGLGTRVFDDVLGAARPGRAGQLRAVGLDATPAGRGIYAQRGFVEAGPEPGSGAIARRSRRTLRRTVPGRRAAAPRRRDLDARPGRATVEVFGADRAPGPARALASAPELARDARDADAATASAATATTPTTSAPSSRTTPRVARDLVAACLSRPRSRPLILDARAVPGWLAALAAARLPRAAPLHAHVPRRRAASRAARAEPAIFGPEFG